MKFIGVDPGITGAVAVIDGNRFETVFDMPTLGKRLDGVALFNLIAAAADNETKAVIEQAQAMPKQGRVSIFNYGDTYGATRTAVQLSGCAVIEVRPATWKRKLHLGKDKDAARELAIALFPTARYQLRLKGHHNRAEAILLAEYIRREITREPLPNLQGTA